jgi:hypothetical protein
MALLRIVTLGHDGALIRGPFGTAALDDDLDGTIGYDCNLGDVNDGTFPFERIDCDER